MNFLEIWDQFINLEYLEMTNRMFIILLYVFFGHYMPMSLSIFLYSQSGFRKALSLAIRSAWPVFGGFVVFNRLIENNFDYMVEGGLTFCLGMATLTFLSMVLTTIELEKRRRRFEDREQAAKQSHD